jgi:tungstate transport system permease protein
LDYLLTSLGAALGMIINLNQDVASAVWVSLYTSLLAIIIAALIGIPVGAAIGLGRFPGQRLLTTLLNTLMALPTVVIGLVLFGLFSRQGPFGPLGLLFTPWAMMLGGNIRGTTRTMTTAIALETSKGEFAFGIALGIVLMGVALIINLFLNLMQQR